MNKKLLLLTTVLIVIFSIKVKAQEAPRPLEELESLWKGPTVSKALPLIQIRADQIPKGKYAIHIKSSSGKSGVIKVELFIRGTAKPGQIFPCYLLPLALGEKTFMDLYALYYDLNEHLVMKGRYQIYGSSEEGKDLLYDIGSFTMILQDYDNLLTEAILAEEVSEEELSVSEISKQMLVQKEWTIDTLQVRDRLGNLITQRSEIALEGLPPLNQLTVKFFEDGSFKITGLGKDIGDIQGTYQVFNPFVLFKAQYKGAEFKILSHILIQNENEIVGATNLETLLPGSYSRVGFQFQDTLRLTSKK